MSELELKSCPFCGGEAFVNARSEVPTRWVVGCYDPDCIVHIGGHRFRSPEAASTAWNTRAPAPTEWRDIGTQEPPKDGGDILIYCQPITGRLQGVFQVSWCNPWDEPTTPENGAWCVDDNKHGPYPLRGWCDGDITHWMPLPAAPTDTGREA